MLNFTWWVNRKDHLGRGIFQGGFLGLDNIGIFDRSAQLPTGGYINQSDGTSWMAMYSLNLMRIALELAEHNHVYEDIASKFFEHFLSIAEAMSSLYGSDVGLWDEEDQFFYDVLNLPNDQKVRLRIRSMVGLIPLFAVETLEPELLEKLPGFRKRLEWFLSHRPDLASLVSHWEAPGRGQRRLLSRCRGRTSPSPSCSTWAASISRCAMRRANPNHGSSAATPIGAGPYGCRSISSSSSRCRSSTTTTATTSKSNVRPGRGVFSPSTRWRPSCRIA
jgi:hypothetical protein